MKTTDLIPLILYQLADGDKYGYEIVKQIEDSSNGKIVIKQPTLYSVLKKLEQGRFISSYWQDSEIGGKRHYYKLTDNGKAQLDTYPSFEQLIKDCIELDAVFNIGASPESSPAPVIDKAIKLSNVISAEQDTCDAEFNHCQPNSELLSINENVEADSEFSGDCLNSKNDDIDYNISETNNLADDIAEIKIEPIKIDLTPIQPVVNSLSADSFVTNNENYNADNLNSINIFDAIEPAEYSPTSNLADEEEFVVNNQELDELLPIEETSSTVVDKNINTYTSTENIGNIAVEQTNVTTVSSKFTDKVQPLNEPIVNNTLYNKLTPSQDLIEQVENADPETYSPNIDSLEQVKYLNYIDFSTDKATIKRRKAISKHIQKMIFTCLSLIAMFAISLILASKYGFSKIYYVGAVIVCLAIVFYPILLLRSIPKLRLKYCSKAFKYSVSRDFFIKLSMFLTIVIAVFAYNLSTVNVVADIFKLNNFASFIAPIMFGFVFILDFIYSVICYKNYTK